MSRNLGKTSCDHCDFDTVIVTGHEHPISQEEAGFYFEEFSRRGLVVSNAECVLCGAQYLAWNRMEREEDAIKRPRSPGSFFDLSYRSSFNDEPNDIDRGFASREEISRIAINAILEAYTKSRWRHNDK